jgi:hypothetical protein
MLIEQLQFSATRPGSNNPPPPLYATNEGSI